MMYRADFWHPCEDKKVKCGLCPHCCLIDEGARGRCGVRINRGGTLYTEIYGRITSISMDPIEKKPLHRYHPGEYILSVGSRGCNFTCPFCQNWTISQNGDADTYSLSPEDLVVKAKESNSFGIAYTYNEPFIWFEYVRDTAKRAGDVGLKNVLVSNGYVNPSPLEDLLPLIDAANIDLKSLDENFYRDLCSGRLQPVLATIKRLREYGTHIELTNLLITGRNDSVDQVRDLVLWIRDNLGDDVPLHISRYFPQYRMTEPPTPLEAMYAACAEAEKYLKYVYPGNV